MLARLSSRPQRVVAGRVLVPVMLGTFLERENFVAIRARYGAWIGYTAAFFASGQVVLAAALFGTLPLW